MAAGSATEPVGRAGRSARFVRLLILLAAWPIPGLLDAAEMGRGGQLAATCAACHPADKPGTGIPTIAGRDEREIIEAMRRFEASPSPSHVMHAVALSLSDEELAAVARYLAGQAGEGRP